MLRSFKDLLVWQKSYALCVKVYTVTRKFPADERFGLTAQVRRAAVSVPSNIAEGYNRQSTRDYVRYVAVASGSLGELETQLLLSRDLGFGHAASLDEVLIALREIERMLTSLIRALKARVAAQKTQRKNGRKRGT